MMGHIEHHPNDETILSYAAGSLPAAMALVVGCHLQYCSACRERVAQADAVGGSLMSQLQEKPLSDGRRESMMALLDANPGGGESPAVARESSPAAASRSELPRLLRNLVDQDDFDSLPWKSIVPGMKQVDLKCGEGDAKLLRIAAGKQMPVHTHRGHELTLILRGGYSDSLGKFNAGDFADLDGSVEHQPIADADQDCICLAGMDAPLEFRGWIAKLVQPFIKI
ncbi:ChrR family anti-sigma-E factor [Spongiibacter marinus]|uniref:ChrR family anti-sigma-E factor n=1 Tax=Spongiibacter marinus TaxID=354246 RepID=UPI0035675907